MSIFKPNLDRFSSTFYVAPIGVYELEIMKLSFAKRKAKEVEVATVNVTLAIRGSDEHGDAENNNIVNFTAWLKEEDDFKQLMVLAMSALGIKPGTRQADEEFRIRFGDLDFKVDTDSGTLGSGYDKIVKGRVRCKLSSQPDKIDPEKMYQRFGGFTTI